MSINTKTGPNGASRSLRRNTDSLIRHSRSHFDAAHFHGLMALYVAPFSRSGCRSTA